MWPDAFDFSSQFPCACFLVIISLIDLTLSKYKTILMPCMTVNGIVFMATGLLTLLFAADRTYYLRIFIEVALAVSAVACLVACLIHRSKLLNKVN